MRRVDSATADDNRAALRDGQHPELERYYGWPIERIVEQSAEVTCRLFERADALRALLDRSTG